MIHFDISWGINVIVTDINEQRALITPVVSECLCTMRGIRGILYRIIEGCISMLCNLHVLTLRQL
jgi:hypothetical protein